MTDGREDTALVAGEIEAQRAARARRRRDLKAGLVARREDVARESGVMTLPSVPPPPPVSDGEDALDTEGTLAQETVPEPAPASDPAAVGGISPLRAGIVAVWLIVLLLVWRAMRRTGKERSNG